jgi:hypothetical protein
MNGGCRAVSQRHRKRESRIIAGLLVERHASLVAREEGVSFAKVWRLADQECIELTAGRKPRVIDGCRRGGGRL